MVLTRVREIIVGHLTWVPRTKVRWTMSNRLQGPPAKSWGPKAPKTSFRTALVTYFFYFFCPVCCRGLAGPWLGYTGVKLWPHWILTLSNRSPVIKARARKKTRPHLGSNLKTQSDNQQFSSTRAVQILSECRWSGGFSGLCGAMWWTHFISVR